MGLKIVKVDKNIDIMLWRKLGVFSIPLSINNLNSVLHLLFVFFSMNYNYPSANSMNSNKEKHLYVNAHKCVYVPLFKYLHWCVSSLNVGY